MASDLNTRLSKKTFVFGLKIWVLIGVLVGVSIVIILVVLSLCLALRKKSQRGIDRIPLTRIPTESREIKEIGVDQVFVSSGVLHAEGPIFDKAFGDNESRKFPFHSSVEDKAVIGDSHNQSDPPIHTEDNGFCSSAEDEVSVCVPSSYPITVPSPTCGLPEFSHLGWGHWFTLRDLEIATDQFSEENVIGEGGYGVVYRGHLMNGSPVAVKRLLNNLGQAEKEYRAEVEAIGHLRHKNLVRLLGYCIEGTHRLLVYEYVNNGNLEQWLHGPVHQNGYLTWDARMKILIGTAKALAYLHEAVEPKVVHRDIKSSNILIDDEFNSKISDFGLAKLLGGGKSLITTRVMGTFGYVAPEYANSGLLNEKSDVYSFGVVLLEAITGRDPVDYGRPVHEVNLVEWLKAMVGKRRSEEVVDPNMGSTRPSTSVLKRALLTALRCVDPDGVKRPMMSQVVRMLESEEYPIPREEKRRDRSRGGIREVESQRKGCGSRRDNLER